MKRVVLGGVVVATAAVVWFFLRSGGEPQPQERRGGSARTSASASAIDPARAPVVQKGPRPPSSAKPGAAEKRDLAELRASAHEIGDPDPKFIPAPEFAAQAKANLKSIMAARETGEFPERLDPKIVPAPFEKGLWKRDPQAYLDVVEPGRVWQSNDAVGADPLRPAGVTEMNVVAGDRVRLSVLGVSNAPVTFTSFDGGALDNGLASITVRARPDGVAAAAFYATADVGDVVTIVAASPYASGAVQFTLQVVNR